MFHPWREFRASPLTLRQARLPGTLRAALVDDEVWMDDRLLQAERRCAILHELRHYWLGHVGRQSPAVEADVHEWVARQLVSLDDLLDGMRWTDDVDELADVCWVDGPTIMARLTTLTDDERAAVAAIREAKDMSA